MSKMFSHELDNTANSQAIDAATFQRLHLEISEHQTYKSDAIKQDRREQTEAEVCKGTLPQFDLNLEQGPPLPEGLQGTFLLSDNFNNGCNWSMGIQNTLGRNYTWHGDQGFKFSEDAVEFRPKGEDEPGGLYITANAIQGENGSTSGESTFGEISSNEPVGGGIGTPYNGQPYYIQFTMTGSEDWPGIWMLPVDGQHGQKEIDIHEGNMPGNQMILQSATEQTMNSAYHWEFKDITQQVLLVKDTRDQADIDNPPMNDNGVPLTLNDTPHTYGVLVENGQLTMYFDGKKMGVIETDKDNLKVPMTIIIDNYVWPSSADWHKDNVWTPSVMHVDSMQIYTNVSQVPPQ
ncbi:MAG: hypothetical protein JST89_01845 [Cyanobacteria bacterium SZAS-4]|nr:hypothetical protein [Cyanobacteria bacterium SZAS-4]